MNLCFKPVKLNPLNSNQAFIRHLNGAVYLLGDAFVAAGKLCRFDSSRYNKGFHPSLCTGTPHDQNRHNNQLWSGGGAAFAVVLAGFFQGNSMVA